MKNLIISACTIIMLCCITSCKEGSKSEEKPADDGAAKTEVTQTGQHIGSTTDSTTAISEEPNPSND